MYEFHLTLPAFTRQYPHSEDFFASLGLPNLERHVTVFEFFQQQKEYLNEEKSMTPEQALQELSSFLEAMEEFLEEKPPFVLKSLTILPGVNKHQEPETFEKITLFPSQIISIVGPTGSGKSRLLGDIEWTANGDTPTQRKIKINDQTPDLSWRYSATNQLVAQLSQNMNFVIDVTVGEFLQLHADCRNTPEKEERIAQVIQCANELSGEKFPESTNVTSLSGGQSRALMIADTAILSPSPIVLIDEIENAGIDRKKALDLLLTREKIVLMATHDPLLCLMADQRLIIKHGGIVDIITTTVEEKKILQDLQRMDAVLNSVRNKLRLGETISEGLF